MIAVLTAAIYTLIFYIGASIYSFLNVVIYRVPRHIQFVSGRSFCPKCSHSLTAADLFPIFSWVLLKGKCRYCNAKIPFRYTLVELLGGICSVLCALRFGLTPACIIVFLFSCVLCVVSFVDSDTMEIPDGFIIAGAIIALLSLIFPFDSISIIQRIIGAVSVSLPMFLLCLIIDGAFGGGDIKLMIVCGFFLGVKLTLTSFFFTLILGGAYASYLLITKKKKKREHFAFGPFICLGVMAGIFFGERVLNWYLGFFNL